MYTLGMINEFTAKKIGEVLAFCEVGIDTWKRASLTLTNTLGAEQVTSYIDTNNAHLEALKNFVEESGVSEITLAKQGKTVEKLTKMRDLYVGDEWENATEIMEWSGFFEGAAIVHFALLNGCAQGIDNSSLMIICEEGLNFHGEILDLATSELASVGQAKNIKID